MPELRTKLPFELPENCRDDGSRTPPTHDMNDEQNQRCQTQKPRQQNAQGCWQISVAARVPVAVPVGITVPVPTGVGVCARIRDALLDLDELVLAAAVMSFTSRYLECRNLPFLASKIATAIRPSSRFTTTRK